MNRLDLENYISETFGTAGEQLFAKYPSFRVFRHLGNRKWFAVIMDIPRKNLGLSGDGEISVVEMSRNVQSGNTQNLKSSAAPVRLPAAPAPTPGTSRVAVPAGCVYRP